MTHGDAVTARKYIDEAIGLERKLNRRPYLAVRRSQKAGILMEMGQDGQAREELEKAYEECLEVCTDTGNKYIESRVMSIFRTN